MIGVSARTLEGWELGRRQPTGAARIFLVIASKHRYLKTVHAISSKILVDHARLVHISHSQNYRFKILKGFNLIDRIVLEFDYKRKEFFNIDFEQFPESFFKIVEVLM